jgi:hypothetical protein
VDATMPVVVGAAGVDVVGLGDNEQQGPPIHPMYTSSNKMKKSSSCSPIVSDRLASASPAVNVNDSSVQSPSSERSVWS